MKPLSQQYFGKKIEKTLKRSGGVSLDSEEVSKFGFDALRLWAAERGWVCYHVFDQNDPDKNHITTFLGATWLKILQLFLSRGRELKTLIDENKLDAHGVRSATYFMDQLGHQYSILMLNINKLPQPKNLQKPITLEQLNYYFLPANFDPKAFAPSRLPTLPSHASLGLRRSTAGT